MKNFDSRRRMIRSNGDDYFDSHAKGMKTGFKFFGLWFVFCAILALGWLGVIVWAIVRVVTHFT